MDNIETPRLLYRFGGSWALESGNFSVLEVPTPEALDAALADGWHLDQYAAKEAHDKAQAAAIDAKQAETTPPAEEAPPADEVTPPTRAELEQKATELGITFDGRWGDKKLAAAIDAKLKA